MNKHCPLNTDLYSNFVQFRNEKTLLEKTVQKKILKRKNQFPITIRLFSSKQTSVTFPKDKFTKCF